MVLAVIALLVPVLMLVLVLAMDVFEERLFGARSPFPSIPAAHEVPETPHTPSPEQPAAADGSQGTRLV
ncbi:hypothetical protein FBY35_0486 [Streptomyces sp. SLBN-118]|nr:hypothetical protein FBY35_0486 [Streptomyces sp. SLBN-118]